MNHQDLLKKIAQDAYMDLASPFELVNEGDRPVYHEGITESYMKVQDETGKQFWVVVREA